ncbi:MAG: carboxypeptidase-like regulatory domain-containing protein, partial [Prolixibacteraceae bacterium]
MKKYTFIIVLLITQISYAQNNRQKIRGVITDKLSQTTLPGAAVQLINGADKKGTTSDSKGNFTLSDLSPDRYEMKISYLGYKDVLVPNVVVTSGKETILDIAMEEIVTDLNE